MGTGVPPLAPNALCWDGEAKLGNTRQVCIVDHINTIDVLPTLALLVPLLLVLVRM